MLGVHWSSLTPVAGGSFRPLLLWAAVAASKCACSIVMLPVVVGLGCFLVRAIRHGMWGQLRQGHNAVCCRV